MTVKNIQDMSVDEKFSEAIALAWELDSVLTDGKLHQQFSNSFENFVTASVRRTMDSRQGVEATGRD